MDRLRWQDLPTPSPENSTSAIFQLGMEMGRLHAKIDAVQRSLDLLIVICQSSVATNGALGKITLPPRPTTVIAPDTFGPPVLHKVGLQLAMETLTWALAKLGLWLLTIVLPALLTFGALAWGYMGPLWRLIMG